MEIGSEFWSVPKSYFREDEEIYLSGRTALDTIVRDAKNTFGIRSALLPSYCCDTMIEPFLANNVSVRFYDVYVNQEGKLVAEVPTAYNNEMLYIMKYFGETNLVYSGEGKDLNNWSATVEDLTHSCFSIQGEANTDYWFASYRKWFAVDGIAVAGKRGGSLSPPTKGINSVYCALRNNAFKMKELFIEGEAVNKQEFLNVFSEAGWLLQKDYQGYGARPDSVYSLCCFFNKIDEVRTRRKSNASILLRGINDINQIKGFVNFTDDKDCPLFVPVLVKDGKRDALRAYLIENEIYCPVHWPITRQHVGLSPRAQQIYNEELSLVCDQRYSRVDMERMVDTVCKFFELEN